MIRSAKYRAIVEDPVIRYKPVESLPGIGPVHGRRLRDNGFYTADQVLAQYLALKRNEQRFVSWMSMASGFIANWEAQCFNGLTEWYNTWGQDVKIPKKYTISPSERGSITNRMLLEQKMLQFNSNANEDRLRSLFSKQTISLVDISKSSERPALTLDRLNKSNFNLAENTSCYTQQDRSNQFKKLSSPSPKSVNFKENVVFNGHLHKKTSNAALKRPISPILKSRSLTPDLSQKSRKPLNLPLKTTNRKIEMTSKGFSMNNLNLTGRTDKKGTIRAKSIDNIGGSNTFTKNKSKTTPSAKLNAARPEKLVCTCNYPYREMEVGTSSETDSVNASQNIEKYFVEKQYDVEEQNFEINIHSTPSNISQSKKESQSKTELTTQELSNQKVQKKNIFEEESLDAQNILLDQDNSNEDEDSVISSDYFLPNNREIQDNHTRSMTVDSRDLEDVKSERKIEFESMELIDEIRLFETESTDVKSNEAVESPNLSGTHSLHEGSYLNNSNEDSGLDFTQKSKLDYQDNAQEAHTTYDECSTRFEKIDSRSESDAETDGTFEVNDTTDAESGFHFIATSSSTNLEQFKETKTIERNELVDNETEQCNAAQLEEELKKSNIRLFCDMLSSDLEQLPMEKFRKLKLKILELVYAEIDESVEK